MPIPQPLFLTGQNDAVADAAETVPARLTGHARTMAQGVYQVAEQFYVAVGYGQSNLSMVVGSDGVLVIDCLETEEHARQALSDLRQVSGNDQPIKALIYSHSHPDHISGVRAILDPAAIESNQARIYAHQRLPAVVRGNPSLGLVPPLRLAYTFGLGLERGPAGWVETGLGTQFGIGTTGFLPPTAVFQGSLDATVAGITFHLHEAPSESDDEIVVWFPEQRVLYAADVIQGESLPNLYALRGAVRNPLEWIRALDLLRTFEAEALIFGHGRPLVGRDEVRELLLQYRDALQYIHDQSLRLMARGLTPDELVEDIGELPPRLREHPWLGEFYGTVKQTVPQVYANYYGWFEGDPTFIDRLPRREQAARYVAAMGGRDAVVATAERAFADRDYQWVAEIVTHLLRLDPDDRAARRLKADALRQLGYRTSNPIWRNNYLMGAREIDGTLDRDKLLATVRAMGNPDIAASMPIPLLLRAFATRLNPARSEGTYLQVAVHCTDTGASYGLAIRSEVAEDLAAAPPNPTIDIETTEPALRGLLTGRIGWPRAVEEGAPALKAGTPEEAARFWSLFDPPVGELPALALR
ncbi:MAG TPA: alkyl sulfatase dimerization domain-containing protein [Thermomicrobiaceae bacterium]|nr:alkyl sulfatase dimerization domain-containing protein [Thermomicrobiaceae bacterium]